MAQVLSVFCNCISGNVRPRQAERDLFTPPGQLLIARKAASQNFTDPVAERVDISGGDQQLWKVAEDVAWARNVIRDGRQARGELLDDGHSKTLDVAWEDADRAMRE